MRHRAVPVLLHPVSRVGIVCALFCATGGMAWDGTVRLGTALENDREKANQAILDLEVDGEEAQPGYYIWAELLKRHVHEGLVDYEGMETDRILLNGYLERITRLSYEVDPHWIYGKAGKDRIAFYLNFYNAATADLILRERRKRGRNLGSIKDIPGAWTDYKWTVAGKALTLDEIEHEILRKYFREPRVHFALVCASRSCPALQPHVYLGRWLDAQLDSAGREFVLDPTRNRFTPHSGRIQVSRIFDWYGDDFVGVYSDSTLERLYGTKWGAVLAYAERFLTPSTAAALRAKRVMIGFLPYDWSLNAVPKRGSPHCSNWPRRQFAAHRRAGASAPTRPGTSW
jgi:Protein of unknown function, DUF547